MRKRFRCCRCRKRYRYDGSTRNDEPMEVQEYDPNDGRCGPCWLDFLYEIFGGFLEPVFIVNGVHYAADGVIDDGPGPTLLDLARDDGGDDIPF